jgi:hypothetical protein
MPSVLSWPFARTLGALALTALTAVCLYHPAPAQDREGFCYREDSASCIKNSNLIAEFYSLEW